MLEVWCYLDPYLYSAWLFIMPVLLMLQRRIQCCWLFLFQPFHMQPPPLLTLPLILDHRWKSSSHPAYALRFWWVFFFQLPVREEQQDNWFYWCREKTAAAFIPVFSSHFSTHMQFAAIGLKTRKESIRWCLDCHWRKSRGGFQRRKQVYLSHLHAGLSAPQTFNLSSCDRHARTWQTRDELRRIPSGSACSF